MQAGFLSSGYFETGLDHMLGTAAGGLKLSVCAQAIVEAHESVRPGRLEVAAGELLEANINRSPTAYLENPAEERAKYKHDIDKNMTLLHLTEADGRYCLFNTIPCIPLEPHRQGGGGT